MKNLNNLNNLKDAKNMMNQLPFIMIISISFVMLPKYYLSTPSFLATNLLYIQLSVGMGVICDLADTTLDCLIDKQLRKQGTSTSRGDSQASINYAAFISKGVSNIMAFPASYGINYFLNRLIANSIYSSITSCSNNINIGIGLSSLAYSAISVIPAILTRFIVRSTTSYAISKIADIIDPTTDSHKGFNDMADELTLEI